MLFIVGSLVLDAVTKTAEKGYSVISYPYVLLLDLWVGIKQVYNLRSVDIQPIENYEIMGKGAKIWYAFSFLVITIIHVVIILGLSLVPGAELAKELLK
jgi:hypothetical protein